MGLVPSDGTHWTLADLHDLPWSVVEGAHVQVEQHVDDRDPLDPAQDDRADLVRTETREGELVGRHQGWNPDVLTDWNDPGPDYSGEGTVERYELDAVDDAVILDALNRGDDDAQ